MSGHANRMRLLQAMVAGDQVYLAEDPTLLVPLARQLHSSAARCGGKLKTEYFLATDLRPENAHRIVRVTMVRAFNRRTRP